MIRVPMSARHLSRGDPCWKGRRYAHMEPLDFDPMLAVKNSGQPELTFVLQGVDRDGHRVRSPPGLVSNR